MGVHYSLPYVVLESQTTRYRGLGPTVDTVISLSFWTAFQSVFMTVSGRTLQFECECLPRSRSHERLHNIVAYLHEDGAVASPRVQDLPFPLQRARFPSDGSARSCHVLVDNQVCPLQLSGVSRTIISRGAERSSVFLPTRWERTKSLVPILTSSLWAANSLTSPSVSSFADSAKPRIRTVLRREYCSRSSQRSSRLTTLTCRSPIWASCWLVTGW